MYIDIWVIELRGSVVVATKECLFTPPRVLRTEIIPLANGRDKNVIMSCSCNGIRGSQNVLSWKGSRSPTPAPAQTPQQCHPVPGSAPKIPQRCHSQPPASGKLNPHSPALGPTCECGNRSQCNGNELQFIRGSKSQDTAEAALSTGFRRSEVELECSD